MITIAYNQADLMTNAPHGANPFWSCQNWARQVSKAANDLELDCQDVYEDSDVDDTWRVGGYISATNFAALIRAVDRITESEWYDYRPQEDDRW